MQKILLYTSTMEAAYNEIISAGGKVPLELSDKVMIAALPDDFNTETLKFSSENKPENLDTNSERAVKAWEAIQKKSSQPDSANTSLTMNKLEAASMLQDTDPDKKPAVTSQTMNGKIAVGVVVISGPQANGVEITQDEYNNIITEVIEGNEFLSSVYYEANITFSLFQDFVTIDEPPKPEINCKESLCNSRKCEEVFRDPALVKLNFSTGYKGVCELVNSIINKSSANWGYAVFFSKYPMEGYAYSYDNNIYMTCPYDAIKGSINYTAEQIDQVYVHETCHVFGAGDEYNEDHFTCLCCDYGTYPTPNNNCVVCSYLPKTKCLMEHFWDKFLCNWTRGQIGWGYWNLPFKKIGDYRASNTPALTSSSGTIYLAFNAKGNNGLYTICSANGTTWSKAKRASDYNAKDAPSLAYSNNLLFMAWRGDVTSKVRVAYSSDNGNSWKKHRTNFETSKAPSLTFFNNLMFVAWVKKSNSIIQIAFSNNNGQSWTNNTIGFKSSSPPAITSFNNQFFLAWMASDGYIHIAHSPNGIDGWFETLTNFKTNHEPGWAVLKNRLYLSFKDASTSNIYYASSLNGESWGEQATMIDNPAASNTSPSTQMGIAITAFDNKLSTNSNYLYMAIAQSSANEVMTCNFIPGVI